MFPRTQNCFLLAVCVMGVIALALIWWPKKIQTDLSAVAPRTQFSTPRSVAGEAQGQASEVAVSRLTTANEAEARSSDLTSAVPESFNSPADVAVAPMDDAPTIAEVSVVQGRLNVEAENARLGWILDQITRQATVAITMGDGVAEQPITVQFSELPLEQGLREILREHDAFFYYPGGATVLAVWVHPRNEGRGLYPVPAEDWASTAELDERLADPEPEQRAWAIETLVERTGQRAQDAVLTALGDANENVRTSALHSAVEEGIELPGDRLSELALDDPSVNIRFLALQALAGDPNRDLTATWALDDPNPMIRDYARRILDRLDKTDRLAEPRAPAQAQQQGQLQGQ